MHSNKLNDIQRLYVQARCVMMTAYVEDFAGLCANVDALWYAMTPEEQLSAIDAIPSEVYATPLEKTHKPESVCDRAARLSTVSWDELSEDDKRKELDAVEAWLNSKL